MRRDLRRVICSQGRFWLGVTGLGIFMALGTFYLVVAWFVFGRRDETFASARDHYQCDRSRLTPITGFYAGIEWRKGGCGSDGIELVGG
jgi:hypothetical protein